MESRQNQSDNNECRKILRKFNIKCEVNEKNNSFIDSYKLFKYLGFDNVFSLDYSDYEGSEIIHNFSGVDLQLFIMCLMMEINIFLNVEQALYESLEREPG